MNKFLVVLSFLFVGQVSSVALYDFQINDLKTLNYALTLEHLENAFYRDGCNTFSSTQFNSAGYNTTVYNYICTLINGHEASHVEALTSVISTAGGDPVPECTYNFTSAFGSVNAFLGLAQVLENTGVTAYDGAIRTLTNVAYQQVAATIATVEARHAAYLNLLTGADYPFPTAFDDTQSPAEIATLITTTTGLIVSCDGPALQLPVDAAFTYNAPTDASAATANDVAIVNYALTLEYLEYNFYLLAVGNSSVSGVFDSEDFEDEGYDATLFTYLGLIRAHELAHVNTLKTVANPLVVVCEYNFTDAFSSVGNFLATALALERAGVGAYDGAVNGISGIDYRQLAATIATVEARHASYLASVNEQVPFPDAYDTPLNESTILNAVSPYFITSCPYSLSLLNFEAPALYSPAALSTTTAGPTTSGDASTSGSSTTGSATTDSPSTGAVSAISAFALIAAIMMTL